MNATNSYKTVSNLGNQCKITWSFVGFLYQIIFFFVCQCKILNSLKILYTYRTVPVHIKNKALEITANLNQSEETGPWHREQSTTSIRLRDQNSQIRQRWILFSWIDINKRLDSLDAYAHSRHAMLTSPPVRVCRSDVHALCRRLKRGFCTLC